MADSAASAGVRDALHDLQRYFSDELAPLMVMDSVDLLLGCPPEVVAEGIHGWVGSQFGRPGSQSTVSDCLFHAIKKLHMMSEFDLVPEETLKAYLDQVTSILIEVCPAGERELFRESLTHIGEADGSLASSVDIAHIGSSAPQAPPAGAPAVDVPVELAGGLKRFGMLIDRLGQSGQGTAAGGATAGDATASAAQSPLLPHAMATAAVSSRNGAEFEQHLARLSQVGVRADMNQVLRALGQNLPGWIVPAESSDGPPKLPRSRSYEALEKIVTMVGDPNEGAQRFNEMMRAAIEQFNAGRLIQAMTMFGLAEKILVEKRVGPEQVKTNRDRGHESLEEDRLRAFADQSDKHDALRKVLEFFPALTPRGLLSDLDGEPKRERRKLSLALLEVHGAPARAASIELLETYVNGGVSDDLGYFRRNLVFLLRRIPPPDEAVSDLEHELLTAVSSWDNPSIIIKETFGAIARLEPKRAERLLAKRVKEFETRLLGGELSPEETGEAQGLLDRAVSALARVGTQGAARHVVAHAFTKKPQLGDTMGRLKELSGQDLSRDNELLQNLLEALDQEMPKRVLGFVVQKKTENALSLIQAISGTTAPEVRVALEELAQRYGSEPLGEAAARALTSLGASGKPVEQAVSLSGDVELFGLPQLLQTLADSQVSGELMLQDREAQTIGTFAYATGKVVGCAAGKLRGETAFYQLFEVPVPGTFNFKNRRGDAPEGEAHATPIEVMPTILESMRRFDEFQEARALVPDDATFKGTDAKPTPPEGEDDPLFMRQVWIKASAGASPAACEEAVASDSYRIRRLYAHWVEQGALQ